jgi:lipoprotein-releasing system permease protein
MWLESKIALRFLRQNLVQTSLILVGIAVGVSVIVFITTLIIGLQENIIQRTLGTQSHIRIEPADEINLTVTPPDNTIALRLEDPRAQRLRSINNWPAVQNTLDTLPSITAVSPVTTGPAFVRRASVLKAVSLIGIEPERYVRIIPVDEDIVAGRFKVGAGDAVIGTLLARDLGVRIGSKVRIETGDGISALVNIAGIFELGVRDLDLRYMYVDLKQAQALLELPGGVTQLDVTVKDIFSADKVARRIRDLVGLKAESWIETNAQLMNALSSQRLSSAMISFFVALSVAFGIASVLAISVTQRTREIGILRAMGTQRPQMIKIFLIQGGLLGLMGAGAGAVLGTTLVWMFNTFGPRLFYVPLDARLIPVTMVLASVTGILAASVPAWRAARLNPVEAIRYV